MTARGMVFETEEELKEFSETIKEIVTWYQDPADLKWYAYWWEEEDEDLSTPR